MEAFEKENGRFWTPLVQITTSTSMDAARFAVEHIKRLGKGVRRIGVECPLCRQMQPPFCKMGWKAMSSSTRSSPGAAARTQNGTRTQAAAGILRTRGGRNA